MRTKHHDRRVERTRSALKHALYELIDEKGYDQVTVEEITDRANLGRATFYLHYRDKEDLLLEDVVDLVDQMVENATGMPWLRWKQAPDASLPTPNRPPPMVMVFRHVAENAKHYRIILRGQGTYTVGERLREIIIQAIKELGLVRGQEGKPIGELPVPIDVIANYYAGSVMGLVSWWLENDTPYTPEQMADYFQRLFFPGLMQVLGLPRS